MLACEMIARYLRDAGISAQFGLLGEGNIAIATALDELGVGFVGARREDAAVGMADGWARRTGSVGFASVTQGPGFTNTVTALTEASRHRTPLVLLTGVTARGDLANSQRFPSERLTELTGAVWWETRGTRHLADDVRTVVAGAITQRRPHVLGVYADLLYEVVDDLLLSGELPESLDPAGLVWRPQPTAPAEQEIGAALDLLAAARNPLVLVGRGAGAPQALKAIRELADHLDAPLATTLLGKGLLTGDDRHIGICGGFATARGADTIGASDVVVAFGCSLNPWTATELLQDAAIIHIDADPAAIGRWRVPAAGVVGDAALSAEALLTGLRGRDDAPRTRATTVPAFDPAQETRRSGDAPLEEATAPFQVSEVAVAMREWFPADAVLASDTGQATADMVAYIEPAGADHFIYTIHAGSIGLGLAAAVGASMAVPDHWTVHFTGDGSLMMSLQELSTIAQHRPQLIIVVLDDAGYGAEVLYTQGRGLPSHLAAVPHPDLEELAAAFGIAYHRIETLADLAVVHKIASGAGGPALVHVPIAKDSASRFFRDYSTVEKVASWGGGE
jgi:acetolactate synthase I/II/III large subunit